MIALLIIAPLDVNDGAAAELEALVLGRSASEGGIDAIVADIRIDTQIDSQAIQQPGSVIYL
jgi:hypothetical protein